MSFQHNLSQTMIAIRKGVMTRGWGVKSTPQAEDPPTLTTGHQDDTRRRILGRLMAHRLPNVPGKVTYGMRCAGRICDACACPIFPYHTQYLLEFGSASVPIERQLRMHRACFLIWREYSNALGAE